MSSVSNTQQTNIGLAGFEPTDDLQISLKNGDSDPAATQNPTQHLIEAANITFVQSEDDFARRDDDIEEKFLHNLRQA